MKPVWVRLLVVALAVVVAIAAGTVSCASDDDAAEEPSVRWTQAGLPGGHALDHIGPLDDSDPLLLDGPEACAAIEAVGDVTGDSVPSLRLHRTRDMVVTVCGSGFRRDSPLEARVLQPGGDADSFEVPAGRTAFTVALPADAPNGEYLVRVEQGGAVAVAEFSVPRTSGDVSVYPRVGLSDDDTFVRARSFVPGGSVDVQIDGAEPHAFVELRLFAVMDSGRLYLGDVGPIQVGPGGRGVALIAVPGDAERGRYCLSTEASRCPADFEFSVE